jgi:hypothetical protein
MSSRSTAIVPKKRRNCTAKTLTWHGREGPYLGEGGVGCLKRTDGRKHHGYFGLKFMCVYLC